jgi:hypothetical protein
VGWLRSSAPQGEEGVLEGLGTKVMASPGAAQEEGRGDREVMVWREGRGQRREIKRDYIF